MKINTRALGIQVTKERPQLMQFRCFEEPNGSDPSVFYSHTVCLRLRQPTFPMLSTGMFSWKPGGEVGDPGKTVLSSGDVASVSPGGTASAGGRRGMLPCHSKEPWLPHAVSPTPGVSLSPPLPCGLWKLGMFLSACYGPGAAELLWSVTNISFHQADGATHAQASSVADSWGLLSARVPHWAPKHCSSLWPSPLLGHLKTLLQWDTTDHYSPRWPSPLLNLDLS